MTTDNLSRTTGTVHGVSWVISRSFVGFGVYIDGQRIGTVRSSVEAEQLRDEYIQDLIATGLVGELDGVEA